MTFNAFSIDDLSYLVGSSPIEISFSGLNLTKPACANLTDEVLVNYYPIIPAFMSMNEITRSISVFTQSDAFIN